MKIKKIIEIASSLTTGLAGLFTLLLFMTVGSLAMLRSGGYETINSMPLFQWVREASLSNSWWLIISLVVLIAITINTILCTIQSLISKAPVKSFLLKISPQIIHAGFLFILLAHLFSSTDSLHFITGIYENQAIQLNDHAVARFSDINISTDGRGFPLSMSSTVTVYEGMDKKLSRKISPNNPAFYGGLGIYLKNARIYPYRQALIEISRDRGAPWALIGGILFFIGNTLLIALKWRYESTKP